MKENLNEVAVGYEGGLYDWIEYLSLSEKYLPAAFNKSSISLDDETLQIELNNIVWEHFSVQQQDDEIEELWPGTGYVPK